MRNVFRGAYAFMLVAAVANCGLLKKTGGDAGDAEAEASVAADADVDSAAAPAATAAIEEGPKASNENDIARFPDEAKLENVAATVQRPSQVREVPVTGKVIVTLAKGAAVSEIAQRDKYFLVVFADAKDPSKKVMGWVYQDAFSPVAAADAGVKTVTCGTGETALYSDGPFCGKVCERDADCASGQACKGSANKLVNGKAGDAVTVCTVQVVHDAGAPVAPVVPHDAGLLSGDGGLGGLGKLIINRDAGTAPAPAAPAGDVTDPTGGKCPTGFLLITKDNKCHRTCTAFECKKETQMCIKCQGAKICSANRDLCK